MKLYCHFLKDVHVILLRLQLMISHDPYILCVQSDFNDNYQIYHTHPKKQESSHTQTEGCIISDSIERNKCICLSRLYMRCGNQRKIWLGWPLYVVTMKHGQQTPLEAHLWRSICPAHFSVGQVRNIMMKYAPRVNAVMIHMTFMAKYGVSFLAQPMMRPLMIGPMNQARAPTAPI